MGLFDFFKDLNNYEERKVLNYKNEKTKLIIDTCRISDQPKPYHFETAISHPKYKNGEWIIVELYRTEEEAILGRNKWVKEMTGKLLPYSLKNVSANDIVKLLDLVSKGNGWRKNRCQISDEITVEEINDKDYIRKDKNQQN